MRREGPDVDKWPARVRDLIAAGQAVAPERELGEVLREVGRPPGQVSDAGTRPLQEQRGERA